MEDDELRRMLRGRVNTSMEFCKGGRTMDTNVSSVAVFQRWWVLKSKLFAQESTCSKEILIPTSLIYL